MATLASGGSSMARKGRCRCGNILRFTKGSRGYKTRCSLCGAVVRLSLADDADTAPIQEAPGTAESPMAIPAEPAGDFAPQPYLADGGDEWDPDLPVIELEPSPDPRLAEGKDSGES